MKLTIRDMNYLKGLGFLEEDFRQIQEATKKTKYELDGKRLSRKKTIELLGREIYLSGIGRSAFHWTAARQNLDEDITILFDSSELFQ